MYKDNRWLTTQARTLERKVLNAKHQGPSSTTIERYLSNGADGKSKAIIELRDCNDKGCVIVFDEGQYKINKQDFIKEFLAP